MRKTKSLITSTTSSSGTSLTEDNLKRLFRFYNSKEYQKAVLKQKKEFYCFMLKLEKYFEDKLKIASEESQ